MYNPFNEKIMKKFLNRIENFLKDNDLEIFIVYYNPQFDHVFSASSYLYKLKEGEQLNGTKTYGVLDKENEGNKANQYKSEDGEPEEGIPSFEFVEVPPPNLPAKKKI